MNNSDLQKSEYLNIPEGFNHRPDAVIDSIFSELGSLLPPPRRRRWRDSDPKSEFCACVSQPLLTVGHNEALAAAEVWKRRRRWERSNIKEIGQQLVFSPV